METDALNAFATGMNKNAALVAVSTGLLNNMGKDEVEAVLGHELTHIRNGDVRLLVFPLPVAGILQLAAAIDDSPAGVVQVPDQLCGGNEC